MPWPTWNAWKTTSNRIVTPLSLIVALVALYLAYRSDESLKKATPLIQTVSENVSTRYIGDFPSFMPKIIEYMDKAGKSIEIACDVPAYGIYSNHGDYTKYRSLLDTKKTEIDTVKLIVLTNEEQQKIAKMQFSLTIDQLKAPTNIKFQEFLKWSGRDAGSIRNIDDFLSAISEEHQRVIKEDFRGMERKVYSGSMPIYLWIADDKFAVFSIPNLSKPAVEAGFFTSDHKLITTLRNIFNTYDSAASPLR